jgi:hypothetical protein
MALRRARPRGELQLASRRDVRQRLSSVAKRMIRPEPSGVAGPSVPCRALPLAGAAGILVRMGSRQTAEAIDRFNDPFLRHDPSLLTHLVAEGCVTESITPAPDGTR